MSSKSFEERRAALRERVQKQITAEDTVESPSELDSANTTIERDIVVKPMIDLDYDDREN